MDRNERKEKFLELGELIKKAGLEYSSFLLASDDISHLEKIQEIETKGDKIEDVLNQYFTQQKNIPYLTLDRAKLLTKLDETLDQILLAAKTVNAFGKALPDNFISQGKEIGESVASITSMLSDAVATLYDDFQATSQICNSIEDIRDKTSQAVFNLEQTYFHVDETSENWKSFIAVSRIARRTNAIVNATKAASEIIQIMCMKYI